MSQDNKIVRFPPLKLRELTPDQTSRLKMTLELLMGVLSEFGWEDSSLYQIVFRLHKTILFWIKEQKAHL